MLKNTSIRSQWGSFKSPILTLTDEEYIFISGCRIIIFNKSDGKCIVIPHHLKVKSVYMISLSPCGKYLAAGFIPKNEESLSTAYLLLFDVESQYSTPRSPRMIKYCGVNLNDLETELKFNTLEFSADSSSFVCSTSHPQVGVLIFDTLKATLTRQIPMNCMISLSSFSMLDISKLCVTGSNGTFQFWRCTSKSCHLAPIEGISKTVAKYTFHAWITENHVVASTTDGYICLAQGCEQICNICYDNNESGYIENIDQIANIIVRGDLIAAISERHSIYLFEFKRLTSLNNQGTTAVLVPMVKYKFPEIKRIYGLQWSIKDSRTSYEVVVSSSSAIFTADLNIAEITKISVVDECGDSASDASSKVKHFLEKGPSGNFTDWIHLKPSHLYFTFHSGCVNHLCLSSRTSVCATLSLEDESIRIRSFNSSYGPDVVEEHFSDRKSEIPLSISLHPSGFFLAIGSEDFLREYAIADSKLEPIRKVSMKTPFVGINGNPFVNSQPVTLVRYSHGGHLLAAVTGKVAQIFHRYKMSYSNADSMGYFTRVMFLSDHTTPIVDLVFSHDDTRIYTSGNDGSVYSWKLGAKSRETDFYLKGLVATCLTSSPSPSTSIGNSIAACFESSDFTAALVGKSRQQKRQHLPISRQQNAITTGRFVVPNLNSKSIGIESSNFSSKAIGPTSSSSFDQMDVITSASGKSTQTAASRPCIAFWKGDVTAFPNIVNLEVSASSIALGNVYDAGQAIEICIIGLVDGRILISSMPIPTRILNNNSTVYVPPSSSSSNRDAQLLQQQANDESSSSQNIFLDESSCKSLSLHCGRISTVTVSESGLWIFSAGVDGSVYMINTNSRAKDFAETPEFSGFPENTLVITEKSQLNALQSKMHEVDNLIEDNKKDNERLSYKLNEQKVTAIKELETRLKREIQKRDDIILKNREDFTRLTKQRHDEIEAIRKGHFDELSNTELSYEKKLAQEALYLDRMKQAYDEYVVHARIDLRDMNDVAERRVVLVEENKMQTLNEVEKQKSALLSYVDFIAKRHDEVLTSIEEKQAEEKTIFKSKIKSLENSLDDSQRQSRSENVQLSIVIQRLKTEIAQEEEENLKVSSDLEWSIGRIQKLEQALHQSSLDIKKRTDAVDKLEYKIGDQQHQIHELERIRKALTSQLHSLRQEIGPKEEKLMQITEKLNEVDREYEVSLNVISDKEELILKKGENLHLLQKQIRELRRQSTVKDSLLRRVAKLFDEYKFALREAQFCAVKKTVDNSSTSNMQAMMNNSTDSGNIAQQMNDNNHSEDNSSRGYGLSKHINALKALKNPKNNTGRLSEIVEVISKSEGMDRALKGLDELLHNFLKVDAIDIEAENDAVSNYDEQERHIQYLHRSVDVLKTNIDHTVHVASTKVQSHLRDNQRLLDEVNSLRHEIRNLSMENQRLIATIDHNDRKWKQNLSKSVTSNLNNSKSKYFALDIIGEESNSKESDSLDGNDQDIIFIKNPRDVIPGNSDKQKIDFEKQAKSSSMLSNESNSLSNSAKLRSSKIGALNFAKDLLKEFTPTNSQTSLGGVESNRGEDDLLLSRSTNKKKHAASLSKKLMVPKKLASATILLPAMNPDIEKKKINYN